MDKLFNYDAEIGFLGLLIESHTNSEKHELLDEISSSDFYDNHNARIFKAIVDVKKSGEVVDTVTVGQNLINSGDEFGGYGCLTQIAKLKTGLNAGKSYLKTIKDMALKRKIFTYANELSEKSLNGCETSELLKDIEDSQELSKESVGGYSMPHISSYADLFLDKLDERIASGGAITGLETGMPNVDKRTNGLKGGWLVVVAGRPSHGKTFFSQAIAEHVAINQNKPIAFFSMEMSGDELVERAIVSQSGVDYKKISTGQNLTDEDWGRGFAS